MTGLSKITDKILDEARRDAAQKLADADAERINIPANPRHYWRYRMHLTIEQLLASEDFNQTVKELVKNSGR